MFSWFPSNQSHHNSTSSKAKLELHDDSGSKQEYVTLKQPNTATKHLKQIHALLWDQIVKREVCCFVANEIMTQMSLYSHAYEDKFCSHIILLATNYYLEEDINDYIQHLFTTTKVNLEKIFADNDELKKTDTMLADLRQSILVKFKALLVKIAKLYQTFFELPLVITSTFTEVAATTKLTLYKPSNHRQQLTEEIKRMRKEYGSLTPLQDANTNCEKWRTKLCDNHCDLMLDDVLSIKKFYDTLFELDDLIRALDDATVVHKCRPLS